MARGRNRRNWRIVLDGRTEVARRRATLAETAIAWYAEQSGCPIERLTAADRGSDEAERAQHNSGAITLRDGRWVAERGRKE